MTIESVNKKPASYSVIHQFHRELEAACETSGLAHIEQWALRREGPSLLLQLASWWRTQTISTASRAAPAEFCLSFYDGTLSGFRLEIGPYDIGTQHQKITRYMAEPRDERRVLWLMPDQLQLQASNRLIAEAASHADPSMFWLTVAPRVNRTAILAPIWHVAGEPLVGSDSRFSKKSLLSDSALLKANPSTGEYRVSAHHVSRENIWQQPRRPQPANEILGQMRSQPAVGAGASNDA